MKRERERERSDDKCHSNFCLATGWVEPPTCAYCIYVTGAQHSTHHSTPTSGLPPRVQGQHLLQCRKGQMIPKLRLHLLQCVLHFFCLPPVRCVWVVVGSNGERAAVDAWHASCIAGRCGNGCHRESRGCGERHPDVIKSLEGRANPGFDRAQRLVPHGPGSNHMHACRMVSINDAREASSIIHPRPNCSITH